MESAVIRLDLSLNAVSAKGFEVHFKIHLANALTFCFDQRYGSASKTLTLVRVKKDSCGHDWKTSCQGNRYVSGADDEQAIEAIHTL